MGGCRGDARLNVTTAPAPSVEGLLVVLPVERHAAREVSSDTPVAGIPLLRRITLAGERAGFAAVVIARPGPVDAGLLAGTRATLLSPRASAPRGVACRIVLLPANLVPQPQSLRRLLHTPLEPDRLYVDRTAAMALDVKDAAPVHELVARCPDVAELRAALRALVGGDEVSLDSAAGFGLASASDVPDAEAWLLRGLIKPNESFLSRHFERRLSLAVTRRLVRTRTTPNGMTLVSVAVGFAGAPFFLLGPSWELVGALLFLAHSILDGCDGELARLKFLESGRGAALDFWGDNVVHGAIFTAIAAGWAAQVGAFWPLGLGALAVLSTGLVALTVWRRGLLTWALDEHAPWRARIAATLVHRDFIYVILALSAFGKASWFIVVAAIGAPLFLGLLAWIGRAQSSD